MAQNEHLDKMFESLLVAVNFVDEKHRSKRKEYFEYFGKLFTEPPGPVERNGYYFHPLFEPETSQYAYDNVEMRNGDVLVATYAKTGTTWLTSVVRHILNRKDPEMLKKALQLSQFFCYLEAGPISKYEVTNNLPQKRRTLATHFPPSLINLEKYRKQGVKVVHVIRNPKDQAVSWYNFAMTLPPYKSEKWAKIMPRDEKEFYDLYIAGKQLAFAKKGEGYLESVRDWYQHRNDGNIIFLVYEEIKKNPHKEISKLAKFLGEELTDEELDWVVESTSFTTMKKKAEESGQTKEGIARLFRKGQIGDWKNHLTVAQSETIDRKVKEILGDTDIKFIYE